MLKYILILFGLAAISTGVAGEPPPVIDFARHEALSDLKLSPNGDYIAARVAMSQGYGLAIIRLADNKLTSSFSMGQYHDVASFDWASPTRLVFEPALDGGVNEAPSGTGELYGINADGTGQKYLFGYWRDQETTGMITLHVTPNFWHAHVISSIPDDPDHVIIGVHNDNSEDSNFAQIYKLNANSGLLSDHFNAPMAGKIRLLADWTGAVRFAESDGNDMETPTAYYRPKPNSEWRPVKVGELKNARIQPLAFSRDNTKVYLASDEGGDRLCLVEQTLTTGNRRTLSCSEEGDLTGISWSFDQQEVIAAHYLGSTNNQTQYLDPDSPNAILMKRVQLSFPGEIVFPVSTAQDGSKSILFAYSDHDPGGYYLFDVKSLKISPIGAVIDEIVPEQMGERRLISFKSRDGRVLNGILTIPPGVDPKSLPLVVHPHGGPFGAADGWRWDPDSQLLATHGYAVLQVNYRGSGGFGKSLFDAGSQAWNTGMIDDITDGVRWVEAQGIADPKRVCIFGASYGGYAALMSAVREPDLYRCTVDFSGIYDLNLQAATTDTMQSEQGRNYYKEFVGETAEQLRAASPRTYIDKLKAAIMIVHGEDDQRVPFSQAKALREDLDLRHYPYVWMVKSGEGHGFYSVENRAEFYTRLLVFLENNIGPGALAVSSVVGSGGSAITMH